MALEHSSTRAGGVCAGNRHLGGVESCQVKDAAVAGPRRELDVVHLCVQKRLQKRLVFTHGGTSRHSAPAFVLRHPPIMPAAIVKRARAAGRAPHHAALRREAPALRLLAA